MAFPQKSEATFDLVAPALLDLAERSVQANQPLVLLGEVGVGKTSFAERVSTGASRAGHQIAYLDGAFDHDRVCLMLRQLRFVPRFIIILDRVEATEAL